VEIRIAARRSPLARRQAELFAVALRGVAPDVQIRYVDVETEGDRRQGEALSRIGGKGVFTAEIEAMLLRGEVDVAVHSLKDLPTALASGLRIAALLPREDPLDVLVGPPGTTLAALPYGAAVGTSSPRRKAQLWLQRPDLSVLELRGNVGTRLRRVESGEFAAAVMAAAGLLRMGRRDVIAERLDPDVMLGAPGQGIIAVEALAARRDVLDLLRRVAHRPTERLARCERTLLMELGGGCAVPVGALADAHGREIRLTAAVFAADGSRAIRVQLAGTHAAELGRRTAEALLTAGAGAILSEAADHAG